MNVTPQTAMVVWQKGRIVPGYDPSQWRMDVCDAWMAYTQYGNRNSPFGWEVDHIVPTGGDGINNLQPLQWENNVAKSNGRQVCAVTSAGNQNVPATQVVRR